MNGGVEFNGIVGAFILLALPVLMAIAALISSLVYLINRKSGLSESSWSKYFLLSALIFLFFDGIILLFLFTQNTRTLSREEAVAFDKWTLAAWLPAHAVGYFLLAAALRFWRAKKEPINKFIDKLR